MGNKIKIGMLKAMPEKWNVAENWAVFERQFATHGKDTDVFITPECFLDGYAVTEKDWTAERFAEVAQDVRAERVHPTGMRNGMCIAHPHRLWIHRKTRGIFLQRRYIGEPRGKNCRHILQNAFAIARPPFCARR